MCCGSSSFVRSMRQCYQIHTHTHIRKIGKKASTKRRPISTAVICACAIPYSGKWYVCFSYEQFFFLLHRANFIIYKYIMQWCFAERNAPTTTTCAVITISAVCANTLLCDETITLYYLKASHIHIGLDTHTHIHNRCRLHILQIIIILRKKMRTPYNHINCQLSVETYQNVF